MKPDEAYQILKIQQGTKPADIRLAVASELRVLGRDKSDTAQQRRREIKEALKALSDGTLETDIAADAAQKVQGEKQIVQSAAQNVEKLIRDWDPLSDKDVLALSEPDSSSKARADWCATAESILKRYPSDILKDKKLEYIFFQVARMVFLHKGYEPVEGIAQFTPPMPSLDEVLQKKNEDTASLQDILRRHMYILENPNNIRLITEFARKPLDARRARILGVYRIRLTMRPRLDATAEILGALDL